MTVQERPPAGGWLRPGDRPCEWMRAGLMVYRLCDRDGDCESCPLDAALRGGRLPRDQQARAEGPAASPWSFPDDRLYHPGHLWVCEQQPGVLRCGVDAFVVMLCASPSRLVLPAAQCALDEGKAAVWIGMDSGLMVRLRAPVSGTVLRRNPSLQQQPTLVSQMPYDAGWLFELQGELAGQVPGLLDAVAMRRRAEQQRAQLLEHLHEELARQHPELKQIAADGGELSTEILHTLDAHVLTRLLDAALG
ncbi:MAG: hypothetical protein ABIJ09_13705 [Pseudomonadota bacterium]